MHKDSHIRRKPAEAAPAWDSAARRTEPAAISPQPAPQTGAAAHSFGSVSLFPPADQLGADAPAGGPSAAPDGLAVQASLRVSTPGDPYEQEAERMADTIMRAPAGPAPSGPGAAADTPPYYIQRAAGGGMDVSPQVEGDIGRMRGGGAPLPAGERSFFEQRFGHDFSQIRIHADDHAASTARSLNARAFTVGSDIAFDSGEYQPGSESGRHLLAHELTHTIQQTGGVAAGPVQRKPADAKADSFQVERGQVTFDAEGSEQRGRYFSRAVHWPGGASGVTIGRGYDLGQHTREQILRDMAAAGISRADAQKFAEAAGLKGDDARVFFTTRRSGMPEISPEQQERLFEITYNSYAANAERISNKKDVREKYGETDWDSLHPAIRDIVVDLLYRGDYTPTTRRLVQPLIAQNNLNGFYAAMSERSNWRSVPQDRFRRRVEFLKQAVEGGAPEPLERGGEQPDSGGQQTGGVEAPAEPGGAALGQARVTADALNVRSGRSTQSRKVGRLVKDQEIEVLGEQGGWLTISYRGKTAYVLAAYTTFGGHAEERPHQPPAGQQQDGAAGGRGRREPSGRQWVSQFPTSRSTADLAGEFAGGVERFIGALRQAGASVRISATLRPPERAYLMHYAWRVAHGDIDPADVPARDGVSIDWVHRDRRGRPDLAASRAAAQEMVSGYDIVYRPSLTSRHTQGLAIDMTIIWSGTLSIVNASGHTVRIGSSPRTGAGNTELHAVGATYGVHKLASDAPHWSSDGR